MENEIKFVKRSKHRKNIMKVLNGKTMMPFEIAREAEVFHNHISYFLGQLKEHGLVECINPEVSKGKLYRLTDLGEKVVDKL